MNRCITIGWLVCLLGTWSAEAGSCNLPDGSRVTVSISGPSYIAAGQTATYTLASTRAASTYRWQVPEGLTITSGQGTRTLEVSAAQTPSEALNDKTISCNVYGSGWSCSDGRSATVFSLEIISIDGSEPQAAIIKYEIKPKDTKLDSVKFEIIEAFGSIVHEESVNDFTDNPEFIFNQTVLEPSSWVWDASGIIDEMGPNILTIIGKKGSATYEAKCTGRYDVHFTDYADELVQAYFLVEGVGLKVYGHSISESYDMYSYDVPFKGKDMRIGYSHISLDVSSDEDCCNIFWNEEHRYNNRETDFGHKQLGISQVSESENSLYNGCSYLQWIDPDKLMGIGRVKNLFWGSFEAVFYSNREVDRSIP